MSVAQLFRSCEVAAARNIRLRHHCNEKSVDVKQGEVTEIDEPDRTAVGGVGER